MISSRNERLEHGLTHLFGTLKKNSTSFDALALARAIRGSSHVEVVHELARLRPAIALAPDQKGLMVVVQSLWLMKVTDRLHSPSHRSSRSLSSRSAVVSHWRAKAALLVSKEDATLSSVVSLMAILHGLLVSAEHHAFILRVRMMHVNCGLRS